ncbi:MAG: DUF1573 domain-containing protein [Candidatus Omnitrophota bacterium]|jgi:hypothetical protein
MRLCIRITILFLLVFLITSGCGFGSSGNEASNVELDDEQGVYFWDFGKVAQGDVLEHTFILVNDSLTTLRIKNIHTSCGCTTSQVDRKEIPPGESVEIKVKFNTQGYSGIKKQYVHILTDRQNNPFIELTLKADIQK